MPLSETGGLDSQTPLVVDAFVGSPIKNPYEGACFVAREDKAISVLPAILDRSHFQEIFPRYQQVIDFQRSLLRENVDANTDFGKALLSAYELYTKRPHIELSMKKRFQLTVGL